MIMKTLLRYRRIIIGGLLPLLCVMLIEIPAWAGENAERNIIKNTEVKWNVRDDIIVINYDLKTDPNLKFKVDLMMKKDTDSSFSAVPFTVEGDVGEGYFAGTNREIRWYYRRDFPQGFEGDGYFFEIHIQEKEIEKESSWLYYALGAAVVAGGMAAFLISKNQEELPSFSTK